MEQKNFSVLYAEDNEEIREKYIGISLENLSYNYVRVFQMAGMDKLATLKSALTDD